MQAKTSKMEPSNRHLQQENKCYMRQKYMWNPLTYNLLEDPELRREKNNDPVKHAYELCNIAGQLASLPSVLNLDKGFSGTMMGKVVEFKVWQQALDTSRAENAAEILQKHKEKFDKCSNMTAGISFNSGNLCISDGGGVLGQVLEETRKKKEKELAVELRRKDAESAMSNKVEFIQQKGTYLHSGIERPYHYGQLV